MVDEERVDLQPFVDAGLYDPAAPAADQRRELLEHLAARFSVVEVLQSASEGPLYSVAASLAWPVTETVSAREAAARADASLAQAISLRSALGFPVDDVDVRSVPTAFVDDLALMRFASEQYGEAAVLAFVRVLASCVARLNEAARAMFGATLAEAQSTELEVSLANELAVAAWSSLPDVIAHQMWEVNARNEDFVEALVAGRLDLAVAFVDLVGSTAWAAAANPGEHRRALGRFEQAAWDVATAHGGRLVKLIGDEAMVVARTPEVACRIAVLLCAAAEADPDLPSARAGVACGQVDARDGDYFGPTVNLAARVASAAAPSTVLATEDVAAQLHVRDWEVGPSVETPLRGIATPQPLSVVRPVDTGDLPDR